MGGVLSSPLFDLYNYGTSSNNNTPRVDIDVRTGSGNGIVGSGRSGASGGLALLGSRNSNIGIGASSLNHNHNSHHHSTTNNSAAISSLNSNERKRRRSALNALSSVPQITLDLTDGDTSEDDDIASIDFSSNDESPGAVVQSVLDTSSSSSHSRAPHTKRLKLDSTAQYIYEKLFIQGEGSDIVIRCLGREWRLHKLYLSQSNYFECMFGGRWLEADQNVINIDIPDSFVTQSALNIAFGSLYCGEVNIPTNEVVAVLSAASLFQLDGMVDLCVKIMNHNINLSTVGLYYNAAQLYGHPKLARKCAKWLQRVLMFTQSLDLLKSITIDLMVTVIFSSNFFVNQVEMDIYTLLKKWVFLRLNATWSGQRRELLDAKDAFFMNHCNSRISFLETDIGQQFVPAFRGLRLQYISADRASLLKVEQDNIIPKQWLKEICWIQWKTMLDCESAVNTSAAMPAQSSQSATNSANTTNNSNNSSSTSQQATGNSTNADHSSRTPNFTRLSSQNAASNGAHPTSPHDCSLFNKFSMRCGRILDIPNNDYCWRWTGFNYGVDLLMLFSDNQLMIKRNVNTHPTSQSLSMQEKREITLRVCALSFDENYNAVYYKTSGVVTKELGKDEELLIMDIDRYATCPIYLSFNVLTTVPDVTLYQQLSRSIPNQITPNSTPAVVGSAQEDESLNTILVDNESGLDQSGAQPTSDHMNESEENANSVTS